jgi:hypothetical protein
VSRGGPDAFGGMKLTASAPCPSPLVGSGLLVLPRRWVPRALAGFGRESQERSIALFECIAQYCFPGRHMSRSVDLEDSGLSIREKKAIPGLGALFQLFLVFAKRFEEIGA